MAEAKRIYAVIVCRGKVPFDMLRYDCCFPDTSEDANQMALACEEKDWDKSRVFILAKYDKMGAFTVERWRSFGVGCVQYKDRYEAKAHADNVRSALEAKGTF